MPGLASAPPFTPIEPVTEVLHGVPITDPYRWLEDQDSPRTRQWIEEQNRVVLSGIGGDEVTGGVPTPIPELMDLLAEARLRAFARQLKVWALNKRKPWFHLFFEAILRFFPSALVGVPKFMRPAPWLQGGFIKRQRAALTGYPSRVRLIGPLPSFQENVSTLETLRRQLACSALPTCPPYEKRYPFLDRELLEFIYALPREQLVRPGHRRSLVRRALASIVPGELLSRKRKAYVARAPMAGIAAEWPSLVEISHHMASSSLRIVEADRFLESLQRARNGQEIPMVTLMRTLGVECWLKRVVRWLSVSGDRCKACETDRTRPAKKKPHTEPLTRTGFSWPAESTNANLGRR